jgi:hypothetical protein
MEMGGQFHGPAILPPGKKPSLTIAQEVGWASNLVWTFRKREKSVALARNLILVLLPPSLCNG